MKYFNKRLIRAYKNMGLSLKETVRVIGAGEISESYLWKVMHGQNVKNIHMKNVLEEWVLKVEQSSKVSENLIVKSQVNQAKEK